MDVKVLTDQQANLLLHESQFVGEEKDVFCRISTGEIMSGHKVIPDYCNSYDVLLPVVERLTKAQNDMFNDIIERYLIDNRIQTHILATSSRSIVNALLEISFK